MNSILVMFWGICAIAAAIIGGSKSGALGAIFGFMVGFLLGPIGVLWAILSKGQRKKCPSCQKMVHEKATRCPFCQSSLPK